MKKISNKVNKAPRLDFKTWLYLYITKILRVEHTPVVEVEEKRRMYVNDSKKNEVYIFKDYDEYKKFFLMYLDDIENDIIDLAIYTRGSKGQIVALKGLCEHLWESYDLCSESNKTILSKCRCGYFNQNCHECLMEEASHKLEYDNIDFNVVNSITDEQGLVLNKTRK